MKGSGDYREHAEAIVHECFEDEHHTPISGTACRSCIARAIEDARRAESEAIAEFVALRGSESGYTHVEDLVTSIRSRGAADPTLGEERER